MCLKILLLQVLEKALQVWDLQVIPLSSPAAEPAHFDPERENAFICHLQDHWFCIRKVNGEWYNFDSLYAAPQHLSRFYLSAYLDSLKGFGWSIFIVRGNFPKEYPISSAEAPSSYGQWLSPEDAERISKSCDETRDPARRIDQTDQMVNESEEADLKAAIAASLMDAAPSKPSAEGASSQDESPNNEEKKWPRKECYFGFGRPENYGCYTWCWLWGVELRLMG